jgi:hypothetical protein
MTLQNEIDSLATQQAGLMRQQFDLQKKADADAAAKERSRVSLHAHIGRTLQRDLALGRVLPSIAQAFVATEPAEFHATLYVELAAQVLNTPLYDFEVSREGYSFAGNKSRSIGHLSDLLKSVIGPSPTELAGDPYWLDSLLYAIAADEADPVEYALANKQKAMPSDLTLDDIFYLQSLTGEGAMGNSSPVAGV